MNRVAGLFPGQGSQTVGMGQPFLSSSEFARATFAEADSILGYGLSEICLQGPAERLTLTENAQPAILLVSYICWSLADIELHAAAGHSLGEYSALVAAGCLSFQDALQLVHKRGKYMQEAVPAGQGKMSAIMGPSEEQLRAAILETQEGLVEIANLNSPGQTVVAGDAAGIDAFSERIQAAGGKVIPLNVSAPFHCRLMKPAADRLAKDLDAISFSNPRFPVYSNVTASVIETGDQARERLKQQVCSSVRWTDSMLNLVKEQEIQTVVEFGAGGVLSKLMKRIAPQVKRLEVADPSSLEKTRQESAGA